MPLTSRWGSSATTVSHIDWTCDSNDTKPRPLNHSCSSGAVYPPLSGPSGISASIAPPANGPTGISAGIAPPASGPTNISASYETYKNEWGVNFESDQYLNLPVDNSTLQNDFTLSGWFNFDGSKRGPIFYNNYDRADSSRIGWRIWKYNTTDYNSGMVNMYFSTGGAWPLAFQSAAGILPDDVWVHMAVTRTSGNYKLYIDGNEHSLTQGTEPAHNLGGGGSVGLFNAHLSDSVAGAADDISIFSSALDQNAIDALYGPGTPSDVSGAAGYWRMGDDSNDSPSAGGNVTGITDSSGNGNDATTVASSQPTFRVLDSISRNYVKFDGSYSYLKATPTSNTDVYGVSAFVYLESDATPSSNLEVMTSVSTTAIFGFGALTSHIPSPIVLVYPAVAYAYADPNGSIPKGWHHLMMAWSPTSQINSGSPAYDIYLDGTIIGNAIYTGIYSPSLITMSSGAPFYVGSRATQFPWSGLVDNIAVFGTQLTSSDITSIYNNGVPGDVSALNPAAWWRMGEDDSFNPGDLVSQVTDHSGNGLHLVQTTANYMKPTAGESNSIYVAP